MLTEGRCEKLHRGREYCFSRVMGGRVSVGEGEGRERAVRTVMLAWGSGPVRLEDVMGDEVRKLFGVKSQSILFAMLRNLETTEVHEQSTLLATLR